MTQKTILIHIEGKSPQKMKEALMMAFIRMQDNPDFDFMAEHAKNDDASFRLASIDPDGATIEAQLAFAVAVSFAIEHLNGCLAMTKEGDPVVSANERLMAERVAADLLAKFTTKH